MNPTADPVVWACHFAAAVVQAIHDVWPEPISKAVLNSAVHILHTCAGAVL